MAPARGASGRILTSTPACCGSRCKRSKAMAQPNSPNIVSTPSVPGQSGYDAGSDADVGGWRKVSVPVTDWPGERGSGAASITDGRLAGHDNWVVTHRT